MRLVLKTVMVLGLAGFALAAGAGEKRYTVSNAKWQAECGSCHIAYPPQLLPAASWQRIMSGLDRHFGTDASMEAKATEEIGAFLAANAARGKRAQRAGNQIRITETPWFRHEHDEVSPAVWKGPKVKSAANCAACHLGAERGDYSEHNVRMPR